MGGVGEGVLWRETNEVEEAVGVRFYKGLEVFVLRIFGFYGNYEVF